MKNVQNGGTFYFLQLFKKSVLLAVILEIFFWAPVQSFAQEIPPEWKQDMELKFEYRHFKLDLALKSNQFFIQNEEFLNTSESRDGMGEEKSICSLVKEDAVEKTAGKNWDINIPALEEFLRENVAPKIDREPSSVRISRDKNGEIIFEGYGEFGRKLNIVTSANIIAKAAKNGINKVTLSVQKTDPVVEVLDEDLKKRGVKDLISVGWSSFTGSPANRRHNILVGSSKLNGSIAPKGEVYSFNNAIGPITETTGYKKELVILGEKTLPEYGGGLCQVSSTFYRGLMVAGFPIKERRNHSYSVSYYFPIGSDLTTYAPSLDGKFLNDTPGDILIQTRMEGDELFFHYYGTRDDRKSYILGPYLSNYRGSLPPRYTTTTELPPGKQRQLSAAHDGMDANWWRMVQYSDSKEEKVDNVFPAGEGEDSLNQKKVVWENFFSRYRATRTWIETGVSPEEVAVVNSGNGGEEGGEL